MNADYETAWPLDPVIQMMNSVEAKKRRANVEHVLATNNLEGVRVSAYVASKLEEYAKGTLSSSEVVAAVRAKYGISD